MGYLTSTVFLLNTFLLTLLALNLLRSSMYGLMDVRSKPLMLSASEGFDTYPFSTSY